MWQRVEELCRAAIRITSEHDLERVLNEIVNAGRTVIGARYAALGVLGTKGRTLTQFHASGIDHPTIARIGDFPTGHGILGVLIDDPKPLRLKDLTRHPKAYGFPAHHPEMKSFLGVPILGRDEAIGNLYLCEKIGADEFSEEDETFAVMLAAHAAVAVENARLFNETTRLLDQVRRMQASRERFQAMINHEMRNALTAVYGWSELLLKKLRPDPPRAAREVYESTERTLKLLEDLLDLSRIEANRLKLAAKPTDAARVLREAVSTVEPLAKAKTVAIETAGFRGELPCHTDPTRVRQVLVNLLTNAIRHSPEGDTVTIEVIPSDRRLRFEVIDRGEGIPGEQQAAIFEEFERGNEDDNRGTGLGLPLSRKLAGILGGTLGVQSSPGHGARFIFDISRDLTQ